MLVKGGCQVLLVGFEEVRKKKLSFPQGRECVVPYPLGSIDARQRRLSENRRTTHKVLPRVCWLQKQSAVGMGLTYNKRALKPRVMKILARLKRVKKTMDLKTGTILADRRSSGGQGSPNQKTVPKPAEFPMAPQ